MLEIFKQLIKTLSNSDIGKCIEIAHEIAGFDLTPEDHLPFKIFHTHITSPQPQYITSLRSDPSKEYWYHVLVNGILGNTQSSFACVRYHLAKLQEIEERILGEIEKTNYRQTLGNQTVALGNTRIWDFEYQAFVLAYRRCLDQFATALSGFFKNKKHSFRTLPDFLSKRKPESVALALKSEHAKHVHHFDFVLSEGGITSVRDRIAHFEFVQAATINLTAQGLVLVGGGEELNLDSNLSATDMKHERLSANLEKKTAALHACISGMIDCYVREVAAWDRKNAQSNH